MKKVLAIVLALAMLLSVTAAMAEDVAALRRAQEDARAILAADPALEQPEHRGLHGEVRLLFSRARGV